MKQVKIYLFLFLTTIISYGQLLLMTPWQDDQSLFFKLQHINEKAGYFGYGPFGEGTYKYIITPFVPVYYFFGLNIVFYFLTTFLFYLLSVFVIYFLVSKVFSQKIALLSAFIYACGYIASDSYIRLFNSVVTSFSVILVTILTFSYFKYFKTEKNKWYMLALLSYIFSIEFVQTRTHYLISVVILFELLFFTFKSFPRSILKSVLRLIPFIYFFYKYFLQNPDGRSGQVKDLISGIISGNYYLSYGFLSSFANLVIPDWITSFLYSLLSSREIFFLIFILFLIFTRKFSGYFEKRRWMMTSLLVTFFVGWFFISKKIYNTQFLVLNEHSFVTVFLGGIVLFILFLFSLLFKGYKRNIYLFFLLWVILNLAAYSAYSPTVVYETYYRYLAHSFFPLTLLFSFIGIYAFKKPKKKIGVLFGFIIFIVLGNLVYGFNYQNKIVNFRSKPVDRFYAELKTKMPVLNKGDLVYFDVADDMRVNFSNAFSVASMPEETAIAWRYGMDRYDFKRIVDYSELEKNISEISNFDLRKVHSFYYTDSKLIDISEILRKRLENASNYKMINFKYDSDEIIFLNPIVSVTPNKIKLRIKVDYGEFESILYPIVNNKKMEFNNVFVNKKMRDMAFKYYIYKTNLYKNMKVLTTSEWREDIGLNLIDDNIKTSWRPDRILWHDAKQGLILELDKPINIGRIAWINAYPNNSPTDYIVETSVDNKNWVKVSEIKEVKRIEEGIQTINFFSPVNAKYVKVLFRSSLSDDSPGISEIWPIDDEFKELNLNDTEEFLNNPYGYIENIETFSEVMNNFNENLNVNLLYFSDKSNSWKEAGNISITPDDIYRNYEVILPVDGLIIEKIKISPMYKPFNFEVKSVHFRSSGLKE